jgi:hypothetical protein
MAERLDDEDQRPGQDRRLDDQHPEVETAEFEAEQPARDLTGVPRLIISVAAVAVSLYARYWVVRPQPAQPYRRTLVAGDRRVPLFEEGGAAAHLVLSVRR